MRNENGTDEPFQFIINKAKVASEVTLTLEAEGDPSTFEMTLNVMRDTQSADQEMMKLVRYSLVKDATGERKDDEGSINAVST